MTFQMPHPVKDKKSGIYYFRVRVPVDLVSSVGRREVSKSLGTRDLQEATERFTAEYGAVLKRWKALRAKPEPLPFKQIVALAGKIYARMMEMLSDEPGPPAVWEQVGRLNSQAASSPERLERWYGETVDGLLIEEGIATDDSSRMRLLAEVQKAWEQFAEQQAKRAGGDFSPDPQADRFPSWEASPAQTQEPTLTDIFERWKKDHLSSGKAPATDMDFEHKKDALAVYLGHEDTSRITPRDCSAP